MRRVAVAGIVGAALLAAVDRGTAQQPGTAQKVGQKVDEALRGVKKGAQDLASDVRDSFERTRASVHSMGLESRIYGRLHWDKALNTERITVKVDQDGVATLSGEVASAAGRTKAVALANDTVGVTRVVDRLAIRAPSSGTPSPAPAVRPPTR